MLQQRQDKQHILPSRHARQYNNPDLSLRGTWDFELPIIKYVSRPHMYSEPVVTWPHRVGTADICASLRENFGAMIEQSEVRWTFSRVSGNMTDKQRRRREPGPPTMSELNPDMKGVKRSGRPVESGRGPCPCHFGYREHKTAFWLG
jgi:hypothetical protein